VPEKKIIKVLNMKVFMLKFCQDGPADLRYRFWSGLSSKRAIKGVAERSLADLFRSSRVPHAHAHRFRDTLTMVLPARLSHVQISRMIQRMTPAASGKCG
jgi:hypothetical protein